MRSLSTFLLCFCVSLALLAQDSLQPPVYLKKIEFRGNQTTKEHIILREMSLKVGDQLTGERLEYDQKRIYSLKLFNRVQLTPTAEGDSVNLLVDVSERWYLFPFPIIGFKYRDVKNLYYGAGIIHQNFRGRNERIGGSFGLGFDRWAQFYYQTPKLTFDDDIFFGFSAGISRIQNQNISQGLYTQNQQSVSITFGKRFGLNETVLLSAGFQGWRVSEPKEGRTLSSDGYDKFFLLIARYSYDTRDIKEYTSEGFYGGVSASKYGFGESDVNIVRLDGEVKYFKPIIDNLVLGARFYEAWGTGSPSPPYLHVYFGYAERIRGHFKKVVEGENSVGGNLELRYPIFSPRYYEIHSNVLPPEFQVLRYGLYAGLFIDGGKVWFRNQPWQSVPWYSGVGGGLHFLLPYSIIVRTEAALNNKGTTEYVLDFGASF
ncbi:MAG: BamA/TamA family outer membrane protein [bacterium]